MEKKEKLLQIKITDIVTSPFQGRLFDITNKLPEQEEKSILSLSESIKQNGLMQPVVVRLTANRKYELIDGQLPPCV